MNILGISAYYHDSAACLVKSGKVVAAAQEERFSRIKHDARFPSAAIDYERCVQLSRQALEPRGQVRGVADGGPDHAIDCLDVAHEGNASCDSHADREVIDNPRRFSDRKRRDRLDDLATRLHRGALFVREVSGRSKYGHHAVTIELDHAACMPLHDLRDRLGVAVHRGEDLFRTTALGEARVAADVDNQHRDLALA